MAPERPGWRGELADLAATLAGRALAGAADAIERLRERDPYQVIGYRGYGTAQRGLVLGRVLEAPGIGAPDAAHSRWRNLLATLKRLESDPLPFARVRAHVAHAAAHAHELEADDEGFVRAWIATPLPDDAAGWQPVELELAAAPRGAGARAIAPLLVPPATARFGVVSDMDDTVLQSEVTNFVRAARVVLLENALTRLPFPGVAAFYRALGRGATGHEANPVFYVSSSPWNLYDVIDGFLEAQKIPPGPLLLRDWDIGGLSGRHAGHKAPAIREILATYPHLPFVLVGDSGQEDPEIYSALVREHPGRILAVYIRNVTPDPMRISAIAVLAAEVKAAGSTLVLADDTVAAARHAAEHGWIAPEALPEIGDEKRADDGTTAEKEKAPGVEDTRGASPTVVVEGK